MIQLGNQLHGIKFVLRSWWSLMFQEFSCILCNTKSSQEPATDQYSEPDKSNLQTYILFLWVIFYYPSKMFFHFQVSDQNFNIKKIITYCKSLGILDRYSFRSASTVAFLNTYCFKSWGSQSERREGRNRLRVPENMVLRRMFAPKRDEVTGVSRKLHY